jgi:pimeloyl-ACP methyl ester carboxylesterase
MRHALIKSVLVAALGLAGSAFAADKPTIVLVHGAFADSSSWNGVINQLHLDGYTVVAAANPLRSVKTDAAYVAGIVHSIHKPVVLVGHSYGGSVISEAAEGESNVKALVFVSALAAAEGETAAGLSGKFPGSTLGPTLAPPVPLVTGGNDLYIQQDKFPAQFAADVPLKDAAAMAAGQRPITDAALNEAETTPAWTHIPSWHIYGSADRNIPPAALAWLAERAKSRKTVVVNGASHVVMVSHPKQVASLIEDAANATN